MHIPFHYLRCLLQLTEQHDINGTVTICRINWVNRNVLQASGRECCLTPMCDSEAAHLCLGSLSVSRPLMSSFLHKRKQVAENS
ncbi:hypothetical protein XELAEV_18020771mg [Xenopus laevis]|uniref:Uncharacterized protein n=1 Tax=Xenopus laevis TaxID=8355 RepID=A0A974HQS4_XENLA|nr:hypothetical protein XELAEV_18020771mg [Xenopus laevis]